MSEQAEFRELLSHYFSESELRDLTFDLGLDYEMLPGRSKGDKARELITVVQRNGRLPELVAWCKRVRPNVQWPELPSKPPLPAPTPPPPEQSARPGRETANPFTYGNPISDPARFFGREREVEQVFSRLRNAEAESSSIVGGRRIGKTSLLNYLSHPDVRRRFGLPPEQSIFVYVDLQMVDNSITPARLWQRLLEQMTRHCQEADLKLLLRDIVNAGSFDNFALADLFDVVESKGQHVVFLLDEFENVTINPNFDTGFFYGLRSLAIQHCLSLVTSSRHELIELTHSEAIRSSPFFNIFANINVRLFSEDEARQLLATSLAGTGINFSDAELTAVDQVAGGHPFFLQAAGHLLFQAYAEYDDAENRRRVWLQAFREEVAPHLAHYWRTCSVYEQITLLLLALLSRRADGGRPAFDLVQLERLYPRAGQTLDRLDRLGYVAGSRERHALFSATFGEWILKEITTGDHARDATSGENGPAIAEAPAETQSVLSSILPHVSGRYWRLLADWTSHTLDTNKVVHLLQQVVG